MVNWGEDVTNYNVYEFGPLNLELLILHLLCKIISLLLAHVIEHMFIKNRIEQNKFV